MKKVLIVGCGAIGSLFAAHLANAGEVDLSVVWNLDFWGKYRRQTEAARATLLASQWGHRAVLTSVISNVAAAYFTIRELDWDVSDTLCISVPGGLNGVSDIIFNRLLPGFSM